MEREIKYTVWTKYFLILGILIEIIEAIIDSYEIVRNNIERSVYTGNEVHQNKSKRKLVFIACYKKGQATYHVNNFGRDSRADGEVGHVIIEKREDLCCALIEGYWHEESGSRLARRQASWVVGVEGIFNLVSVLNYENSKQNKKAGTLTILSRILQRLCIRILLSCVSCRYSLTRWLYPRADLLVSHVTFVILVF